MSTVAIAPVTLIPSTTPTRRVRGRSVAFVFLLAFCLAWLIAGTTFTFTNDEGIYLEGARSLLEGKVLYKDHFAFTGPGTYWLLALCFKIFGLTIAAGRLPFVCDIAITTAFSYWMVSRVATRYAGMAAAAICFAIQVSNPDMQNTNHRWDSAAFACLAIAMSVCSGKWGSLFAGIFAAAAAWCSPPVILLGGVLGVWHWRDRSLRWFLAGGAVCSAVSIGVLVMSGSIRHLIPSLLWASANYSEANRVPYGFLNGGIANIYAGGNAMFGVVATIVLIGILAPAIFPVVNLLAIRQILRAPSEVRLVAACSAALIASCYPRVDTPHLTNVFAPTLAVSAWILHRFRFGRYVAVLVGLSAALLFYHNAVKSIHAQASDTRSGMVRGKPQELESIAFAHAAVPKGASLFVYPYLPMMYFVTEGVNPTEYSFLQPGMMTSTDEARVLASLKRNPPQYVLFYLPSAAELLRIWPNSDLKRLRMPQLESWIQVNYTSDPRLTSINTYNLYHRRK